MIIWVDSASGSKFLEKNKSLLSHHILIEIGNPKNLNSNPIAEKAIQDIEKELKTDPTGAQVSSVSLAIACYTLNCRDGSLGLSPWEILYHRDQPTNECIHFDDKNLITKQHYKRDINHSHREQSKVPNHTRRPHMEGEINDDVYLHQDLTKNNGRERYQVSSKLNGLVHIRKFAGSQLRANTYQVREEECFWVPSGRRDTVRTELNDIDEDDDVLIPRTKPVFSDTFGTLANNTITPRDQYTTNQPSATAQLEAPFELSIHVETPPLTHQTQRLKDTLILSDRVKPTYLKDYNTDF